jgi:hypothetical protein
MNLRQIAVLLDDEVNQIINDLSNLAKMAKDQATLDPDPTKLLRIHLQIGSMFESFGSLGEQLFLHLKPEYKDFLPAMKTLYNIERDKQKKALADALAKKMVENNQAVVENPPLDGENV